MTETEKRRSDAFHLFPDPDKHFLWNCIAGEQGMSRIFERGGPISLGSLKKGHQIIKGGGPMANGLMGGGGSSTLVSLGRQILHI